MTTAGGEQKRAKRKPSEEGATVEAPTKTETKDTEAVDKLLDEIDEVLEENAEEFVRSYVQKGGE
jgi:ubiquitin-like protein Pup